ncbi:hypothetical protein B0H14DRAFT_2358809 [Mycena olivaceomarginata]|nr:hypothetical protein B0H14DRAFT_2358809 [Mycena olivaceomarginata]
MTDPSSRPYPNVTQSRCPSKRNQVRNEKGPHFGPTALALEKNSSFTLSKFDLECRSTLHSVDIAYKTWGTLDAKSDNVLVICHPFTRCADVDKWSVRLHLAAESS